MTYINMRTGAGVETIDEFSTYREARDMLAEYRIAYGSESYGFLYLSSRPTVEWREAS